jgi:uncharacterized protein (TIGR03435 family)
MAMNTNDKEMLRLERPGHRLHSIWGLLLLAVAWPALAKFPAFAQVQSPRSAPTAATVAPAVKADGATAVTPATDPTLGLSFDVVSIKHTGQGSSRVTNPGDGDGITITNSTLREILRWNYNVGTLNRDQIQGAPDWFSSIDENYEIHAKVAPSDVATWQKLDDEGRRLVFRKVLAERFKFACHFVDVEVPVYNLVIAKGGLKMKEAKPGEISPWKFHEPGDPSKPLSGIGMTTRMTPSGPLTVFQRMDMTSFARSDVFLYTTGRPVIDKTGLTGVYNFTLDFSWQQISASPSPAGASEPTSPDIFTALQQQLGLKLEPARGLVSHLVVDHIERPSDN